MRSVVRLGIIGCGAVSERMHVPAILPRTDVRLAAAVDRNPQRAELIAQMSGAQPLAQIAEALPHIDAAIVALPHALHAPASIELLEAGKHVLVEKPMAISSAECDAMLAAARRGGASLTIGQMRRFCPAVAFGKMLLEREAIGRVHRFEMLEGNVYAWPVASDFFFRKASAGGGVLFDTGSHTFDMLLWYFGDVAELDYRDDAYGGVEADCAVRLTTSQGAEGYVELSRTRDLPTVLKIEGERGSMSLDYRQNQLTLIVDGHAFDPCQFPIALPDFPSANIWQLMLVRQLDDWIAALSAGRPAMVAGEEGDNVVDFIERCYADRREWRLPWVHVEQSADKHAIATS